MRERFGPIDFDEFHRVELPQRLAECPPLALGRLRPIAFRLEDGRAYSYLPSGTSIDVRPGDAEASTLVQLAEADWCDFVWELRSSFALLYAGGLEIPRGSFGQLSRWEPVMRTVLDGQAVYDLEQPRSLVDAHGGPFVPGRSFSLEDGDDDLADTLGRAGFLHLRDVFTQTEVAALRADVEAAVSRATPEDNRSWWTTVEGREVCNRVNYLNESSEVVAELGEDPRLRRIGRLGGEHLRLADDRLDGHAVVIKVPGADSGLADLPWHRDCGMGGHPVKCPMLNVGIQLDAASAATGRLELIAGSHVGSSPLPTTEQAQRLPVVAVDTDPGDVTVHWGHTLHAAPPPLAKDGWGRRALYLTFVQPLVFEMIGPGQGYNDVLFARSSGRVRHVAELG